MLVLLLSCRKIATAGPRTRMRNFPFPPNPLQWMHQILSTVKNAIKTSYHSQKKNHPSKKKISSSPRRNHHLPLLTISRLWFWFHDSTGRETQKKTKWWQPLEMYNLLPFRLFSRDFFLLLFNPLASTIIIHRCNCTVLWIRWTLLNERTYGGESYQQFWAWPLMVSSLDWVVQFVDGVERLNPGSLVLPRFEFSISGHYLLFFVFVVRWME